jgi:hypothetical protein
VAELNGRVVGSNVLWENGKIAGVGPITVDPDAQGESIGRRLMEDVLRRAKESGFEGIRLVQTPFNNRSMSLYSKLGFDVKEPLALMHGQATVLVREERITGYATSVGFLGHAIGETNEDLKALISEAQEFTGAGFHIPSRNTELMRWCLARGLRIRQPMTLMSIGPYKKPAGAFMPSVLF